MRQKFIKAQDSWKKRTVPQPHRYSNGLLECVLEWYPLTPVIHWYPCGKSFKRKENSASMIQGNSVYWRQEWWVNRVILTGSLLSESELSKLYRLAHCCMWLSLPSNKSPDPLTAPHSIRFIFYHRIKDNERNLCEDLLTIWKHRLGLESARAALCQWATCTRDFPFKNFCKLSQHAETIRKKMFGKRVMTCTVLVVDTESTKNSQFY